MAEETVNTTAIITPSAFGSIDLKDLAKSAATSAVVAIVMGIYDWANTNTIPTGAQVRALVMATIAAFLGNLVRSYVTNSAGQFLKSENIKTPVGNPFVATVAK